MWPRVSGARSPLPFPGFLVADQGLRTARATTTGKRQVVRFPAVSVALHTTIVLPGGKKLPEGGVHTTLGIGSRQSAAVTENITVSPGGVPRGSPTSTDEGQESVGAVSSRG